MWKFVGEFRWTTNSKIEQGGDEIEKNPSNPKEEGLSLSLSLEETSRVAALIVRIVNVAHNRMQFRGIDEMIYVKWWTVCTTLLSTDTNSASKFRCWTIFDKVNDTFSSKVERYCYPFRVDVREKARLS